MGLTNKDFSITIKKMKTKKLKHRASMAQSADAKRVTNKAERELPDKSN